MASLHSSNNNITKTNDYTNWKIGMIMRLTVLPPNVAKLHLKMLEKVLTQFGAFNITKVATVAQLSESFVNAFLNSIYADYYKDVGRRVRKSAYFECFLKTITVRYNRRRQPLLELSNIVITDVARIQMLGIVCSSVLANGNEYDYQREIQIYENLTRDIAQHMLKWINNELAMAWPDIIIAQSLEAMGSEAYSEKEYVELATLIQRVANERGSDNFTHQVVVAASWSAEFFSKSCEPSTCASIIGKGDVNIVITRYNEMEDDLYERLNTGQKWLKGNRLGMQSELGNQLKLHGGKGDLTVILSYIKSKAISPKNLYGKYFFRNFILLHNRKWFTKDCVIPVGVAGSTIRGMSAYDDKTEYLDTSFYSVANKYKLIFLL